MGGDLNLTERAKQVLIAGAIGDAFGYVVEFTNWSGIVSTYSEKGYTWQDFIKQRRWTVSDDTQMTLFALETCLSQDVKLLDVSHFYAAYQDWYRTQVQLKPSQPLHSKSILTFAELYERQAPGMTCLSALRDMVLSSWKAPINNSKGCGGIMRTAPVGLLSGSAVEAFEKGCLQAMATHGHPDGILSAGWMAALLYELSNRPLAEKIDWNALFLEIDKQVYPFVQGLPSIYAQHYGEMLKRLIELLHWTNLTPSDIPKKLGEGWVGDEALYIAVYAAKEATSWEEMLWISTNHDGDSDSTASLAAQLWAANKGLPEEVMSSVTKLDVYRVLRHFEMC